MNEKDIVPELLELLQKSFNKKLESDEKINKYLSNLGKGNADYEDENEYAISQSTFKGRL